MNYRRKILILAVVTLACWLGLAQAAEFSAQLVTRSGPQELKGKVYLQGEKVRQEFPASEGASVSITRPDKQVVWVIMPGQKMYMEMAYDKSALKKTMQMPQDKAEMKLLGQETVNGYATDKYETTVKDQGREMKNYVWISKKLGVPIKMTSEDGALSMEYLEIKEGNVPASKFEVPPGYQKMTMPQGMPRQR